MGQEGLKGKVGHSWTGLCKVFILDFATPSVCHESHFLIDGLG